MMFLADPSIFEIIVERSSETRVRRTELGGQTVERLPIVSRATFWIVAPSEKLAIAFLVNEMFYGDFGRDSGEKVISIERHEIHAIVSAQTAGHGRLSGPTYYRDEAEP